MGLIDVGGGLGVDYDGSKGWGGRASVNYDAANYANDVVAALADACTRAGIEPPTIVSESGRAIVSASAALVFQIISTDPRGARGGDGTLVASGTETDHETDAADVGSARLAVATEAPPRPTLEALRSMPPSRFLLHNFREVARSLATAETVNAQEAINDATQFRREADRLFKLGIMGLEERAEAEELFCATREGVFEIARARRRKRSLSSNTRADAEYALPVDVQTEARRPAVWYHANMSVFRSLPDVWAIQQLFPVAPLHRLRERPRAAGAVADLTCDSDGRIDAFVGALGEELGGGADAERGAPSPFLALHAPNAGEPYLMAAFLVGAYQESMGSAGHNLFGSPATANVFLDRPEPFETLPNPETSEETRERGRLSFRFASPALSSGASAVVSLRAGNTNAEALRGAGVDPDSVAAWVRGGPTGGGDGDTALLAAVADVLRESTYLESRGLG